MRKRLFHWSINFPVLKSPKIICLHFTWRIQFQQEYFYVYLSAWTCYTTFHKLNLYSAMKVYNPLFFMMKTSKYCRSHTNLPIWYQHDIEEKWTSIKGLTCSDGAPNSRSLELIFMRRTSSRNRFGSQWSVQWPAREIAMPAASPSALTRRGFLVTPSQSSPTWDGLRTRSQSRVVTLTTWHFWYYFCILNRRWNMLVTK